MSQTSVLESTYIRPTRPYSQQELQALRDRHFRKFRIGEMKAEHAECGHSYYVKFNGKKEREMKESGQSDTGNCSVCWKISRTPNPLKPRAYELVSAYMSAFRNEPERFDYELVDIETSFYTWLYAEFTNTNQQQ